MVMILRKSLDNRAAGSAARGTLTPELHTPKKMSRGPTLFSCGVTENGRWRDLDRKCPLQTEQPSARLWEGFPEGCPDSALWPREAAAAAACAVTSLIQDLSLSDPSGSPAAPPSKRPCRSLSFSDELSGCRTSWRPLGSRVWTPVEKRRCYSGGSVQRFSGGGSPMQRSSSFSLPSRPEAPAPPAPVPARPGPPSAAPWSPPAGGRLDLQRSLSCSHDRFSFAGDGPPSASSTPASTPELARRPSGLARSRSQPCVLNDRKAGVKRRRPDEALEPRPSLDLAKMAQNCQTFSSLSSLGVVGVDVGGPRAWTALLSASGPGGRTPAGTPVPEPPPPPSFDDPLACREELCWEETDSGPLDDGCGQRWETATAWRDRAAAGGSPCSLDGELDIEQIEQN
ncbi:protein FAM53B isoform X1 [Sorex fumeus]|uniref:protein FAM53B isoform X1 n=1 Tax=Sorex fumeus TaxID=62283 RepID=UPI0024ACE631|nr:protein FAM53B isoform X1 [Sorex fumeus]